MRVKSGSAFKIMLTGVDGRYELAYRPIDEWAGVIDVTIKGLAMSWHAVHFEEVEGKRSVGGMTVGSDEIWGDQFWFELWPDTIPVRIDYFGDRVLWRSDFGPTAV
jgi:hypothetical protein